jgi:hypothetical protein
MTRLRPGFGRGFSAAGRFCSDPPPVSIHRREENSNDVIGNIGKLTIAGAIVAAMTTSSLAEWVVVRVADECLLMQESEVRDEIRIAGPFATEEEADRAKSEHPQRQIERN